MWSYQRRCSAIKWQVPPLACEPETSRASAFEWAFRLLVLALVLAEGQNLHGERTRKARGVRSGPQGRMPERDVGNGQRPQMNRESNQKGPQGTSRPDTTPGTVRCHTFWFPSRDESGPREKGKHHAV